MSTDLTLPPLALYIHIPWCIRKCPYCDFNSHQVAEDLPEAEYRAALRADLEADLALVQGRKLTSIFFWRRHAQRFLGRGYWRDFAGRRASSGI